MAQGETNTPRQVLWKVTADQVCQLFEQSLRRGPRLMAESLLEYVPESDRTPLLFGLLQREIYYREQAGETMSREEFDRRFPNQELLRDALINDDVHLKRVDAAFPDDDVLERVGRSPIGAVYKVRQRSSGNMMCVRSLPGLFIEQDHPSGCSFTDLAFMLHPNLARPRELVESDGDILLLTEFVEGPTLAGLVAQRHPIPLGVVCEFMRQAASGIIQVHDHFRCHGDLRPQSLILNPSQAVVKVSGLGLTELLNLRYLRYATAPTDAGMQFLGFRAPELGHEPPQLDKRSDVYSLGCTLYYALTGAIPPQQPNPAKSEEVSTFPVQCPRKLEAIIWQMLAIDPDERLDDAAMVHQVLAEFADPDAFKTWCAEAASGVALPTRITVTETSTLDTYTASTSETWPRQFAAPTPVRVAAPAPPQSLAPQPKPAPAAASEPPARPARWRPSRTLIGISAVVLLCLAGIIGYGLVPKPVQPPQEAPLWASSLAEQPDVYGDWWFDEFPWYAPIVRKKILTGAAHADESQIALAQELATAPTEKQMDRLRAMVEEMVRKSPPHDPEWAVVGRLLKIDPAQESPDSLKAAYEYFLGMLDPQRVDSGTARHMRALLYQKMGNETAARESYQMAVDAYQADGDQELEAVCYGDLGRTFERGLSLEAIAQYEHAVERAVSPSLKVALSTRIAFNYRKRNRMVMASEALDNAERFANNSELKFNDNHMLREVSYEERGWLEFDRWRLERAREWFAKAKKALDDQTDADDVKVFTKRLMIMQNDAMVAHFTGKTESAQYTYNEAINNIDGRVRSGLKSQDERNLVRRFPNLYERLGDTYMFGTPADYPRAAEVFGQAELAARSPAFELDQLWPHVANIQYKRVIALCLDFRQSEAETEMLAISDLLPAAETITPEQEQIYSTCRALANAMLEVNQQDADGQKKTLTKLESFCSQRLASYNARGNVSRTDLDVMLLSMQYLLGPNQTSQHTIDSVVRKLEYLIKEVHTDGDVSPEYLYRYAKCGDVALRNSTTSALTAQPRLIADVVSRGAKLSLAPGAKGSNAPIAIAENGRPKNCRLYALSIGVSRYADPTFNLGVAANDAMGLEKDFRSLCEGDDALFECGKIKSLTNEEATYENIFAWIRKFTQGSSEEGIQPVRPGDIVFVTFSGHGEKAHGDRSYFLLPHDYDSKVGMERTAIHDKVLQNSLANMGATVICVLDSCFSGKAFAPDDAIAMRAATDRMRALANEQIRRFSSTNDSNVILLASSISSQPALEDRRVGHGYLTLALREAFEGDYLDQPQNTPLPGSRQGFVTLEDIEYYLGQRVRDLSKGQQTTSRAYGIGRNATLADLPIRLSKSN
ncbi:protein kinase [Blastopirellula sp. JC732]|uniref:Protein kinase n=1 Tax=Blastopirellula sediminis TaxID=2894196 RepID=A0A9X1MII2_9BACT|nr:protein kinase [Blastopirellula sediminis]MCC9608011.1 protein kinase [Blastopirellula sediminis]MCC9627196.1 protein kinase [Blastopirellula sediminis]